MKKVKLKMMISSRNIGCLLCCAGLLLLPPHRIALSSEIQGKRPASPRQAKFEPFGVYVIYEKRSAPFKDFHNFQIGYPKKTVKGEPDKIVGEAQFGKAPTLIASFSSLKLVDTALSFETEEQQGISYVFEGRFLRKGDFSKLPDNTPVLEGTLIKKVKGEETARETLKFAYYVVDR